MWIKAKGSPTQRNSDGEIMAIGVPYEEDEKAANSLIEIDAAELATEEELAKMQQLEAPQVTTKEAVVTPVTPTQKTVPTKVTGEG